VTAPLRFLPADTDTPAQPATFFPAGAPAGSFAPAGAVFVVPGAIHVLGAAGLRGSIVTLSIFAGQALAGDRRWGTMALRALAGGFLAELTSLTVAAVLRLHNSNVYPLDVDWLTSYGPDANARLIASWRGDGAR